MPFGTAEPAHSIVWKVVELVSSLAFGFLLRSSAHIMHTAGYNYAYVLLVDASITPTRSPSGVIVLFQV